MKRLWDALIDWLKQPMTEADEDHFRAMSGMKVIRCPKCGERIQ